MPALFKLGVVLIICKLGLPFKCAISQCTVGLLPEPSLLNSTPSLIDICGWFVVFSGLSIPSWQNVLGSCKVHTILG